MLLGPLRVVLWPLRLVRAPLGWILVVAGVKRRQRYTLPVAGLDESNAEAILFALRRAAETPEEAAVAERWLSALQVSQVAFCRLLAELDGVAESLEFWHRRVQRGGHLGFTLLHQGPLAAARRAAQALRLTRAPPDLLSDVQLAEKRVVIFRLLQSALTEAIAGVGAAALLLYLQAQEGGAEGGEGQGLFHHAERCIAACLAGVAQALDGLRDSTQATLAAQQGPAMPAAEDRPLLSEALSRVLHLPAVGLHRILSRQRGQVAAAAGAEPEGPAAQPGDNGLAGEEAEEEEEEAALGAAVGSAAALERAQRAVGLCVALPPAASVPAALRSALRAARSAEASRLVPLPAWLHTPSQAQQHWVQCTVAGVGLLYGAVFIYRHSALSGSRDMEDWLRGAAAAARSAWGQHVVGPLSVLSDELFNTFRRRPAIVSYAEYEADRDSLSRMLSEFEADYVKKRGPGAAAALGAARPTTASSSSSSSGGSALSATGSAGGGAAAGGEAVDVGVAGLPGMALMMRSYEVELKKPIRNLVGGDLARSLLIQVQKLKVDTESAMLEIDQILRANELTISFVAAVPAFLIGGGALYALFRLVTPAPPDARWEAMPARLAMGEAERALSALAGGPDEPPPSPQDVGAFQFRLAVAYEAARELYARHRGLFRGGDAEWPALRAELLELAGPAPPPRKLRTLQRTLRAYSIYQQ